MKRIEQLIVLGLLGLTLGCGVSKDQYTRIQSQNQELGQSVETLRQQVRDLSRERETLLAQSQGLVEENRRLRQELDALKKQRAQGPAGGDSDVFDESLK